MKRGLVVLFFIVLIIHFPDLSTRVYSGKENVINPAEDGMIQLKYCEFNPLRGEPDIRMALKALPDNPVKLVHVTGPMTQEWITSLQEKGVVFLSFLHDFTYIALLKGNLEGHVSTLPEVLWVGDFHPAYKIQKGLLDREGCHEVNILVWPDFGIEGHKTLVEEKIQDIGKELSFSDDVSLILRARLTSGEITDLAGLPEVRWVDRYDPPQTNMNLVRDFTGADTAASGGGFDGDGIVGEVKDSGCDLTHPDFGNLIATDGTVTTTPHGTCTFGIVFSDHAGNAKGMMYNGSGVFCDWGQSRTGSVANLKNTWDGRFQSNSWSSGTLNGDYSSYSLDSDTAVNDSDVSVLYSAGNSTGGVGSWTVSQDSAAKNVICVGAVFHQDTTSLSDDQWEDHGASDTPSQGPAADGRIKPDICGVYDDVYTTDIAGPGGYDLGDYFAGFGGTSAACPIVAGSVGLIYQMYEENHFGNNPAAATPHAATVKALLIANAHQYALTEATRYQQGWGLADVGQVYDAATDQFIVDSYSALETGESEVYTVERISQFIPIKIVLCWTDEPGETSGIQALINDLDLTVTAPDSTEFRGNVNLITGLYSASGGSFDRKNNVECVFIDHPIAGNYEIEVNAYNIALDNDPAAGVNQSFSLAVSECNAVETNNGPVLSNPSVTPASGYYGTRFDFRVHYFDPDGGYPTEIDCYIDGIPHHMNFYSGQVGNATYRYRTRGIQPDQAHSFYFYAEDTGGGWDRLPFVGAYSGPTTSPPDMSLSGTPGPDAWMTLEVWGAVDALWAAAWSSQPGPHFVPVTGKTWDLGPGDLHMAKKIVAEPVNLDEYGYGTYDFQLPTHISSRTKHIQSGTKANAAWGQTEQDQFLVP